MTVHFLKNFKLCLVLLLLCSIALSVDAAKKDKKKNKNKAKEKAAKAKASARKGKNVPFFPTVPTTVTAAPRQAEATTMDYFKRPLVVLSLRGSGGGLRSGPSGGFSMAKTLGPDPLRNMMLPSDPAGFLMAPDGGMVHANMPGVVAYDRQIMNDANFDPLLAAQYQPARNKLWYGGR